MTSRKQTSISVRLSSRCRTLSTSARLSPRRWPVPCTRHQAVDYPIQLRGVLRTDKPNNAIRDGEKYIKKGLLAHWLADTKATYRIGTYVTKDINLIACIYGVSKETVVKENLLGHFALEANFKRGEEAGQIVWHKMCEKASGGTWWRSSS